MHIGVSPITNIIEFQHNYVTPFFSIYTNASSSSTFISGKVEQNNTLKEIDKQT